MVYVAFIIDVFARKVVGWHVSTSMTTVRNRTRTNGVLIAHRSGCPETRAICQRAPSEVDKLIHHEPAGAARSCRSDTQTLLTPASRLAVSGAAMTTPWQKASPISGLAQPHWGHVSLSYVRDRSHHAPRPLKVHQSGRMGNPEMG